MTRHATNVWIAYADLLFVLFLVVLLAGAAFQQTAGDAEMQAARQANEIEALKARAEALRAEAAAHAQQTAVERAKTQKLLQELERRVQCADAMPLLQNLSECIIDAAPGMEAPVRGERCSVTLREGLLQFRTRRAIPENPNRARAIARCLYRSASEFRAEHAGSFNSIATISVDGHTDCQGGASSNMRLGADRSLTLYELLLQEVPSHELRDRDGVLSKIAIRSYGLHRPLDRSRPCSSNDQWAPDRRVTISVEMRPERNQVVMP